MRKNRLVELFKSVFERSKASEGFIGWAQAKLNIFRSMTYSLTPSFVLGWALLSAMVLLAIYIVKERKLRSLSKAATSKEKVPKQGRLTPSTSKAKEVSKKTRPTSGKMREEIKESRVNAGVGDEPKRVEGEARKSKPATSLAQDLDEIKKMAASAPENVKHLVYLYLAKNLSLIDSNINELSELDAKAEWNRVATVHEAKEVATLLSNQPDWIQQQYAGDDLEPGDD